MNIQPNFCPNPLCEFHAGFSEKFWWKKGTFTPKRTGIPLVRYQCSGCKTTFSNRTLDPERYQKKPEINAMLAKLMCVGVTLRDCAYVLETNLKTICRRADWLAVQAKAAHQAALACGSHETSYVHFDEMQSFEHARPCALTIALAVRHKTGAILSAKVGAIPANGPLAAIGAAKYGWTANQSPAVCAAALAEVAIAARIDVSVACDKATTYPNLIVAAMPLANVMAAAAAPSGAYERMFKLNHACAMIRAKVAVMARRTWTTTKRMAKLQDKLDIYIAVHNGYNFC